jgi:clan AA aspartic protease
MGTFYVRIGIRGPTRLSRAVDALVDTGATHTMIPGAVLRDLRVRPLDRVGLEMADDRVAEFPVGEVKVQLQGRQRTVLAVFGPDDATPLLGATTLELFNLAADPVRKRLVRVRGLLKAHGARRA